MRINIIGLSLLFFMVAGCKNEEKFKGFLVLFNDTTTNKFGYKNQQGAIIIPQGKYEFCFTDTFKTYAIVSMPGVGLVAIDRKEKVLFKVFSFDNGPDYPSEGLFRIIENNKIGFADAASGVVLIKPQFDCAFPFEEGKAKVSKNCKIHAEGEHSEWQSDDWFFIDKTGKQVGNLN